jgi:hypothetical protein
VVKDVLLDERNKLGSSKSMAKSLLIDKEQIEKSRKLIEGMSKLKGINLLTGKDLNTMKLPGMRENFVYNDYHTRGTNPGYSRGELGRYFVK